MPAEFAYRTPSAEEIARITAEANIMRARAVRDAVKGLFGAIRKGLEAFSEARYNARVYNELQSMDDRLLKDIGINRGDIAAVVHGFKTGDVDARSGANENVAPAAAAPRPAA
jgi:uncharacterized protein YjiS (DUF1127 family)